MVIQLSCLIAKSWAASLLYSVIADISPLPLGKAPLCGTSPSPGESPSPHSGTFKFLLAILPVDAWAVPCQAAWPKAGHRILHCQIPSRFSFPLPLPLSAPPPLPCLKSTHRSLALQEHQWPILYALRPGAHLCQPNTSAPTVSQMRFTFLTFLASSTQLLLVIRAFGLGS